MGFHTVDHVLAKALLVLRVERNFTFLGMGTQCGVDHYRFIPGILCGYSILLGIVLNQLAKRRLRSI